MTCRALLALTCGVLLMAGCAGKQPAAREATFRLADAAGLAQAIEKHRGQVVLVDFWATWCGPCMELLPHAAEMQQRLGGRGLAVITVSLDDPDNRAAVDKVLATKATTLENYLSPYGVGPAAFSAFGIEDGALPHLRIYDRQGKLVRTFQSGGKAIDPKQIERAVEGLLEQESSQ